MKYKVIYPDLSECINRYRCVVNGNECVAVDTDLKKILGICKRFAKKDLYTELWLTNSNGESTLCNYWN